MKVFNFIPLLIFLLLLSCKKEDDYSEANFKAFKDGNIWIPSYSLATFSKTENKFMIHAIKKISNYYGDEQLYISFYTKDISALNFINNFYSSWNYVIGGDGVTDSYKIIADPDNVIQINSIDTIKKQISGNFNIKLLRDKFYSDIGETMYFTDGQFIINYLEIYTYNSQIK